MDQTTRAEAVKQTSFRLVASKTNEVKLGAHVGGRLLQSDSPLPVVNHDVQPSVVEDSHTDNDDNDESSTQKPQTLTAAPENQQQQQHQQTQNKRKEKARIAARARRNQEANIILEMANELLIPAEKLRRIDKATVIKLAIDYIKAFDILFALQWQCNEPLWQPTAQRESAQQQQQQQQPQPLHPQTQIQPQQAAAIPDDVQATQVRPIATKLDLHHHHQLSTNTNIANNNNNHSSMPKLSTSSIFAPKTNDLDTSHFLVIGEKENGQSAFMLKPDIEIERDGDDLTHLAPQAGDVNISLDVEPLEGIKLDCQGLFIHSGSPPTKKSPLLSHLEANQSSSSSSSSSSYCGGGRYSAVMSGLC